MKKLWRAILVLSLLGSFSVSAQSPKFKKGILVDEFIFEKTSFPESHAASFAPYQMRARASGAIF